MHRTVQFILLALLIRSNTYAESPKLIRSADCSSAKVTVEYTDLKKQTFPLERESKCLKISVSSDSQYAGWSIAKSITTEDESGKKIYPDASLFVLVKGEPVLITNSRYIHQWRFVPGTTEVFAITSFEHGPNTFVLYDYKTKETVETCEDFEVSKFPRLQKLSLGCTDKEFVKNITNGLPAEVEAIAYRIIQCNHWAGEEGYDEARRAQIRKAYDEAGCSQIEKQKSELLKANSKNEKIAKSIQAAESWKPPACD